MDISLHEDAAQVLKNVQSKKASIKTAVLGRKYKVGAVIEHMIFDKYCEQIKLAFSAQAVLI